MLRDVKSTKWNALSTLLLFVLILLNFNCFCTISIVDLCMNPRADKKVMPVMVYNSKLAELVDNNNT